MADSLQKDSNHLTGKKRININMRVEHTAARAGRAIQMAAMVITSLVALIWSISKVI
jgi:hypothetical protein